MCCVPKLLFYICVCNAVLHVAWQSFVVEPENKIIYCRNYLFLEFSTLCQNLILNLVIFHVKPFSCSPPGLVIVLSAHWVGCIFYFLARLHHFDDSTWLAVWNHEMYWFNTCTFEIVHSRYVDWNIHFRTNAQGFETIVPLYDISTSSVGSEYILCLYKGFNSLTALGFVGNLYPNTCPPLKPAYLCM